MTIFYPLQPTDNPPYKIIDGVLRPDKAITQVSAYQYENLGDNTIHKELNDRNIKVIPELSDGEHHIAMLESETHCIWTPLPYGMIYQVNIKHDYPTQDWTLKTWWSKEPKGMPVSYTAQFKPINLNRSDNTFLLADKNMSNLTAVEKLYSVDSSENYWFNIENLTGHPNGYSLSLDVIERIDV